MSTEDDIVTLRPYAWDGASKAALGRLVEQLGASQAQLALARRVVEESRVAASSRMRLTDSLVVDDPRDMQKGWEPTYRGLSAALDAYDERYPACEPRPSDSPFPQPALESVEKGLGPDREIPGKPADYNQEREPE